MAVPQTKKYNHYTAGLTEGPAHEPQAPQPNMYAISVQFIRFALGIASPEPCVPGPSEYPG